MVVKIRFYIKAVQDLYQLCIYEKCRRMNSIRTVEILLIFP